jgi:glycosidase
MTHTKDFLKEHAVYQIYPISFKDSNQDGKGPFFGR